ncbi:MAG: ester cyclase [Pseudopedobacter saltans]|uniref:Ester cyclase n=1 Tax=Pseudopedobacter saltans TaxID=151895 RepID=A0A2W5EF39_9SPHI|nr:MAG: ester cyclase [Pseudopedobacter saltans]
MDMDTEANKKVVLRFNKEVIEQGNVDSFHELMHPDFVNHSAPEGSQGAAGMIHTFNNILRPALPDLKVTVFQQIAEGDLVTTRKTISGTMTGTLLGIPPTGKEIHISVIDIVRIKDGRYYEHWGINTLPTVLDALKKQ